MNADLITLRILSVANAGAVHDVWRQGIAQVSVPAQVDTATGGEGAAVLGKGGVDICIVDHELPESERTAVINAGRVVRPRPFMMMAALRGAARIDGVDAMVPRPGDAVEARKLVELCARARIPLRTLVVDDSPTTRRIVRKILGASRFTLDVHEASEGDVALRLLSKRNFGMVFLDYNMPGLNGFEILLEIRRADPAVAVVMITSTDNGILPDRVRRSGALDLLKKPFYPADVDAVLERYYGLHKLMG